MIKNLFDAKISNEKHLSEFANDLQEERNIVTTKTKEKLSAIKEKNENEIQRSLDDAQELELKRQKLLKIIEKRNYEAKYPKPKFLLDHQLLNPKSFYIQVLGCRGAGKSTFLNRFFRKTNLRIIYQIMLKISRLKTSPLIKLAND